MLPTREQRLARYAASSNHVRDVYSGQNTGKSLVKIFNDYNLDRARYRDFAHIFGDVVLGFFQPSDIERLVQEQLQVPRGLVIPLAQELRELHGHMLGTQKYSQQETVGVTVAAQVTTHDSPETPSTPQQAQPTAHPWGAVAASTPPVHRPATHQEGMSPAALQEARNQAVLKQLRQNQAPPPQPQSAPAQTETPPEQQGEGVPEVPRYAKPLTDTPQYGTDPYKERVE